MAEVMIRAENLADEQQRQQKEQPERSDAGIDGHVARSNYLC